MSELGEFLVDNILTFDYFAGVNDLHREGLLFRFGPRFLLNSAKVILLGLVLTTMPTGAQRVLPTAPEAPKEKQLDGWAFLNSTGRTWKKASLSAADFVRKPNFAGREQTAPAFSRPLQTAPPGMIGKMEAAFSCNDTPFIDQVRLPVATLWGGRLKLTGFESDVTTANFVLGLPGAGTLPSLSLMGSGHLATHAPPSDQLVGMHVVFYFRGRETGAQENSGLRGMQYLVRGSWEFLQNFAAR